MKANPFRMKVLVSVMETSMVCFHFLNQKREI